jgi:Sec-independent protein secretion pathway component TatC
MAGYRESEWPDLYEGGPVKTFLEHLEDFRWVMVKSVVGLFLFGVSFCYFILMPVALAAAQGYSAWLGIGALQ